MEQIPKDVIGYIVLMDPGDPNAPPLFSCKKCGGEMWPSEPWNEREFVDDFEDWEEQAESFYGQRNRTSAPEPFETYSKNTPVVNTNKVGRNSPCPCRSGKKYKRCCGKN